MSIFATTLLLAGSFVLSDPRHFQTNTMLREAAVDHDLATVKRQYERAMHGSAGSTHQTLSSATPPITR